jgi:hypothetical protein
MFTRLSQTLSPVSRLAQIALDQIEVVPYLPTPL